MFPLEIEPAVLVFGALLALALSGLRRAEPPAQVIFVPVVQPRRGGCGLISALLGLLIFGVLVLMLLRALGA